jgi:hypothetical protein
MGLGRQLLTNLWPRVAINPRYQSYGLFRCPKTRSPDQVIHYVAQTDYILVHYYMAFQVCIEASVRIP